MSLLEKIIYLADFTSADRDYDDVSVIRQYVDESLDKAFVYALQYSICDLAKRKKAIHMGGATQLLFGIKGNRWEDPMYGVKEWGLPAGFYPKMFNEYWIKPGEEGRPKNAEQVEGACYW